MQFGRTSTTTVVETNMVTYQNIFPPPKKKKSLSSPPTFISERIKMQQNFTCFEVKKQQGGSSNICRFFDQIPGSKSTEMFTKGLLLPTKRWASEPPRHSRSGLNDWRSLNSGSANEGSLSYWESQTRTKAIKIGVNESFRWIYPQNIHLENLSVQVIKFPILTQLPTF